MELTMPNTTSKTSGNKSNRGGTHEQHVEAGKQSHKNSVSKSGASDRGGRGGKSR